MNRRYNTRLIRKRRTYSTKEVAALFGMHTRSVQYWVAKEGLKPLEGCTFPYLIHGQDLWEFLNKKKQSQKCPLQSDEFYCLKCHCARKSVPAALGVIKTERRVGRKGKLQGIKTGQCGTCGIKLNRFFTYEKETPDGIN